MAEQEDLKNILNKATQPLQVSEAKAALDNNAIILDSRNPDVFTAGFIPGSINIGLDGRFTDWAGSLLPTTDTLILVTEEGKESETAERLIKTGFTNFAGYVKGGVEAWRNAGEEVDLIIDIEADELAMDLPFDENIVVLDVRSMTEYAEGHIKDAWNVPLNELTDIVNVANIEETQNVYIHCGSGYRSVIAASLLKRQGLHNLRNVVGGWDAIKEQKGIETEKESSALN